MISRICIFVIVFTLFGNVNVNAKNSGNLDIEEKNPNEFQEEKTTQIEINDEYDDTITTTRYFFHFTKKSFFLILHGIF